MLSDVSEDDDVALAQPTTSKVDLLRHDLGQLYLKFNPGFKYVAYQQEIVIAALNRWLHHKGKSRLAIAMPPGHAKTDIGTKMVIPMYLGNNPGHNCMTLSYSEDLAKEFGQEIKDRCASSLAKKLWPHVTPTRDSRSKRHFTTEQNNHYYAVGFNGEIAGRRLDLLMIDDPVKSKFEADSEKTMKQRFDIYRSVVGARMRPGGLVGMNLTRYGMRDFFARVLGAEADLWDVLIVPAESSDGTFLWESYFGRERYIEQKKDPEVWWSTWMQDPKNFLPHNLFDESWACFYKPGDVPRDWAHYIICDPAKGKKTRNDRTSIPVFAAGPERRAFLVDWIWDRLDPGERADAIVRLVRKWKPRRFVYEEQGLVSDTFYLKERFRREGILGQYNPIAVGGRGSRSYLDKEARIGELTEDWREGRIWLPERLIQRNADGTEVDLIKRFMDDEFIPYRGKDSVMHDDGLDSFSRLHEPELDFKFIAPANQRIKRVDRRGGWEAYW